MEIGRRIYYDLITGNVIVDTGERQGAVVPTIPTQDIAVFPDLAKRDPSSYGFLELPYGEYQQDFLECNGYRVDPDTGNIQFSYPDPSNPAAPQPFQKPLTAQLADLQCRLNSAENAMLAIMDIIGGVE